MTGLMTMLKSLKKGGKKKEATEVTLSPSSTSKLVNSTKDKDEEIKEIKVTIPNNTENRSEEEFKDIDVSSILCPPWPPSIVAKCSFWPPKPPTYKLEKIGGPLMEQPKSSPTGIRPEVETEPLYLLSISGTFCFYQKNFSKKTASRSSPDVFYVNTATGNSIVCAYFRVWDDPKYVIFVSATNANDLGHATHGHIWLAKHMHCNVFAYDYSGFGQSTGRPSERNQLADAEAAFSKGLLQRYNVSPSQVVLYGQSIGSAPTVHLAVLYPDVAGVILHSGLLSGLRLLPKSSRATRRFLRCIFCINPFANGSKARGIRRAPVLIVHGTDDKIVPVEHAREMVRRVRRTAVTPLWIEGGGHNDLPSYPQFRRRLCDFIHLELGGNATRLSSPNHEDKTAKVISPTTTN